MISDGLSAEDLAASPSYCTVLPLVRCYHLPPVAFDRMFGTRGSYNLSLSGRHADGMVQYLIANVVVDVFTQVLLVVALLLPSGVAVPALFPRPSHSHVSFHRHRHGHPNSGLALSPIICVST